MSKNKGAHPPIVINARDAEIWAWDREVVGECACQEEGATISLQINGATYPVTRAGSRWQTKIHLDEGDNQLIAICKHPDGRVFTSETVMYRVRLEDRPTARIACSIADGHVTLDGRGSQPGEGRRRPILQYQWRARPTNPATLYVHNESESDSRPFTDVIARPTLQVDLPTIDGEYYVSLQVTDAAGRSDASTICLVVADGQIRPVAWEHENAAWVEQAIVYGVVPHNFGSPGFRSVIERLDYLHDLGINAIWLSPINETPDGGHGYRVTNYFELRPEYGNKADFQELVRQAHARGIRVLMDFVPNHTSDQHRYFQDTLQYGIASPYYHFYDRDADGNYTYYFHWTYLPNLNFDHPEVERWMIEAFTYWVREFDVDGFRVDVAWGIKQRRPDFWPKWRRALHRIRPDLLLLAEASARDPYYFTQGFDAAYDWNDQLGHGSMENAFTEPGLIGERLRAALTNEGRGFHEDALIFRFLNNNDTGPRFITRYGVDLTRVAAAMLLTLPGIPLVYTGEEVGAEFEPYKTPGPISWEDRYGLRPYYQKLIALRRRLACLHSRRWRLVATLPASDTLGYVRYAPTADQAALVLLNYSAADVMITVELSEEAASLTQTGALVDVLHDETIAVKAGPRLEAPLPAFSARILCAPQVASSIH